MVLLLPDPQPTEVAEVIAFQVAPAFSFMTNALVIADGGYTALEEAEARAEQDC